MHRNRTDNNVLHCSTLKLAIPSLHKNLLEVRNDVEKCFPTRLCGTLTHLKKIFSVKIKVFAANIYLFIVNNRDTRKRYEICLKLSINTPERRQRCSKLKIKTPKQLYSYEDFMVSL